jgi:hypothetical protein
MAKLRHFKLLQIVDLCLPQLTTTYARQVRGQSQFDIVDPTIPLLGVLPVGTPDARFFRVEPLPECPEERGQTAVASAFSVRISEQGEPEERVMFNLHHKFILGNSRESIAKACAMSRIIPKGQ